MHEGAHYIMTHPVATLRRAVRRGLATVFAASLLWTTAFVPAQAEGDPSAPPDELISATEAAVEPTEAPVEPTEAPVTEGEAVQSERPTEPTGKLDRPAAGAADAPKTPQHRTRGLSEPAQVTEKRELFTEALESEDEPIESIYGWVWDDYSFDNLTDVAVEVYAVGSEEPYATTTTSYGFYVFEGLPAGSYEVRFFHADFFPEWWNDVRDRWEATQLTVGGDPAEASAELGHRGRVQVTVTNAAKKPLAGRWVQVWLNDDDGEWWDVDGAWTDENGRATIIDLPVGYYQVGDEDLGKDARVKVEGSNVSLAAYSGTKWGGWLSPFITGEPSTGSTMKIDRGSGKWKKTTFSYQWLREGVDVSKATKSSYKTGIADRDKQLQVRMTAKLGNNSFTVVSPTSWWITLVATPAVTGPVAVGSTVTVDEGAWDEQIGFSYRWYADGKAITGATGRSLALTSSHKGKKITVKVTGRFDFYPTDYPDLSRTSAATGKVAVAGSPTISGTLAVGSTVKAKTGVWTKKTKFSYQWLRDGAAISKATKSSYKLTSADAGKLITVRVTGKLSGYATVAKTSVATVKVMASAAPAISGAAGTGNTLSFVPGAWTTGTTFTQQWYADGKELLGETGGTLSLTAGHAGKKITVKVTGQLAGHATVTTTSKATAKVLLVGTVTVTGTPTEGSTLVARPGSWTKKAKLSYQWLRGGEKISKATKSSYKLTGADVGQVVTVRVTGKRSGYATVTAASPAGDPVAAAA